MYATSFLSDLFLTRPSVYVISDSQLAAYKEQQLLDEIAELDRLIDGHKQSIERLEKTRETIASQRISPSECSQTSPQALEQPESQSVL